MPSYLPRRQVVWVLLLLWAVSLLVTRAHAALFRVAGATAAGFALAVFGHVLYHHAGSPIGLSAIAFGAVLALLTPREAPVAHSPEETLTDRRWPAHLHVNLLPEGRGSGCMPSSQKRPARPR